MVVAHGVILAAGRGTRLGAMTADVPKPMLPIGGGPLIGHIVGAMVQAGVSRITAVTGYLADEIERHLALTCPVPIAFIRQPEPSGTAGAVRLVAGAAADQPFLLSWGDIATDAAHYADVAAAWGQGDAAVIGVNPLDDVSSGAAVVFGEDDVVRDIVEKPQGEPPSRWNNAGIMVLGPRLWPHLDTLERSSRGEFELPGAIESMLRAGERIRAVRLTGSWHDIGTVAGIAAADEAFAGSSVRPRFED